MPRTREDTIKTKIELSGEKAYKQACAQINAELRELSSEMKLLSSQYDDNADSTEALRKQQELYNRQLGEQQKKIDAAEKALKELEEAGNGSTEAARRMRIELNKNKTAYADTEKRVRKLADEIDDSESEYRQYVQAAKNVDDTLEELSSEMKLLTEKTKDSADSAETLRQKHDGLEKVFKEQERKVSALEKAYAAAAKDGDRLGRESNELKIALNNAKTAAAKTENEMRDLERAMDSAGDAADDAEDNFGDFSDAISGLGGPFGEAGNLLGDLSDKFGAFGINAGNLLNPVTLAAGGVSFALFEMGKYAVEVASETETAMVNFANQTGLAVEETEKYKDLMQDLYTSGYGEDMEDIATAMARIAQTTGDLEPDKLGDMAKGALTLRDTFDIDVAESIRGANQLVNAFGIDGARAFDMIALAAQLGLNQNDNLLDTINEYAIHYQQLGLSVEDMFASLANAQESGVFDIDKVGDAIKEFGIRVREGGDEVRDVFKDMGLNADDMVNAFNTGGEAAAGALDQVLDALFAIEDETLKNQMGVALFGTMWEDLGKTGIEAATTFGDSLEQLGTDGTTAGNNVNNAFANAEGTLENINNQKFDTLNGQWEILCRNAQTAFEPLGTYLSDLITNALKTVNTWLDNWNNGNSALQNVIKYGGEKAKEFAEAAKTPTTLVEKIAEETSNFQSNLKGIGKILYDVGGWEMLKEPMLPIDKIQKKYFPTESDKIYQEALNQGFEPFEIPVITTFEPKSFAESLGIVQKEAEVPISTSAENLATKYTRKMSDVLVENSNVISDAISELGGMAYHEFDMNFPGFEDGEWKVQSIAEGSKAAEPAVDDAFEYLSNSGTDIWKKHWTEDYHVGHESGGHYAQGMADNAPAVDRAANLLTAEGWTTFMAGLPKLSEAGSSAGTTLADSMTTGFSSKTGEMAAKLQAVVDRVVSQISATVQISAVVGATAAVGGQNFSVTQNIYANETSYSEQQRQAKKALGNVVRSLM